MGGVIIHAFLKSLAGLAAEIAEETWALLTGPVNLQVWEQLLAVDPVQWLNEAPREALNNRFSRLSADVRKPLVRMILRGRKPGVTLSFVTLMMRSRTAMAVKLGLAPVLAQELAIPQESIDALDKAVLIWKSHHK